MLGIFEAIITVLFLLAFIGIAWMAYSPRFKNRHEKDGMIPFLDSSMPPDAGDADKPRT